MKTLKHTTGLSAVPLIPIALWTLSVGVYLIVKGFNPSPISAEIASVTPAPTRPTPSDVAGLIRPLAHRHWPRTNIASAKYTQQLSGETSDIGAIRAVDAGHHYRCRMKEYARTPRQLDEAGSATITAPLEKGSGSAPRTQSFTMPPFVAANTDSPLTTRETTP